VFVNLEFLVSFLGKKIGKSTIAELLATWALLLSILLAHKTIRALKKTRSLQWSQTAQVELLQLSIDAHHRAISLCVLLGILSFIIMAFVYGA